MINRTYIDKATTIIKNSEFNFGLNPIAELNYGKTISRALIHFNIDFLRKKVEDKTYTDITKLKHIIKLTNCGSIDVNSINKKIPSSDLKGVKERATSFEVILFLIPQEWDAGRGFDNGADFWLNGKPSVSKHGCNWYQSMDGYYWNEEGVYSNTTLSHEYDKFSQGEDSIVIGRQHFDFGNENFEIDITNTVNKFINGEIENYGIGLAFSPMLEDSVIDMTQYVGFFTNKTNTFFEPFLETIYNEYISDDRAEFYIGKTNRLYLYTYMGGNLDNLDNLPTCIINEKVYDVKQATKGVYYAEITFKTGEVIPNSILYDMWSNLAYNGEKLDDVEMEFVALPSKNYFRIGENAIEPKILIPTISGINDNENLVQGDKRIVRIDFRKQYTSDKRDLIENAEYRLFVKDGKREVDVITFNPIEKMYLYNFFIINTSELIPNTYYVDIKVNYGHEIRIYKEKLRFNIISNVTEIRR